MSHFNHLVIALPIEHVGILAKQAGLVPPASIDFDDMFDAETESGKLVAGIEAFVKARTNLLVEPFANDEYDPDEALFGVQLHSTYTSDGIPEARSAQAPFGGYTITSALFTRAQAIKAQLVKALPGFAPAELMVIEQHW